MLKTCAAIVFSAVVAAALTGIPDFVGSVSATSSAGVKAIPAPACPTLGWPYQQCSAVAAVRLVTTDRLQ